MAAEIITIGGLLFGNLVMSGAIYFRLGTHDAHLQDFERRILKLEGSPKWIG